MSRYELPGSDRESVAADPEARPWGELSARLSASEPFRRLDRLLRAGEPGRPGRATRLPLPAAAWVVELLARDRGRPALVLVPHEAEAIAWLEAVELFGGVGAHFPAPSLTPYHETDVSLQVRAQESDVLHRLLSGKLSCLVCTPRALFRRLPEAQAFRRSVLSLAPGDELSLQRLVAHLTRFGYHRSDLVSEVGEVAVRGGVVDIFPPARRHPVRLDLFGDTLESVREFSVGDQRSLESLEGVEILPLSLFPAGSGDAFELADLLLEMVGERAGQSVAERLEDLREKGGFPGWENYLPLAARETVALLDLLGESIRVALAPGLLTAEVEHHAVQLASDFAAQSERRRLAVAPELLEHPPELVLAGLGEADLLLDDEVVRGDGPAVDFAGGSTDLFHGQLQRFPREIETARARGERLVVVTPEESRHRLEEWLEEQDIPVGRAGAELASGELGRGFRLPAADVVVFGERQLFRHLEPRRRSVGRRGPAAISSLRDLKVGDFVVHSDHGIGQFTGLRAVGGEDRGAAGLPPILAAVEGQDDAAETEVMEIVYAEGRSLLLPLSRLDLIQRYNGIEGVEPRLDKLGGSSWSRAKARVRKGIRKLAVDLLKLYAKRELARAPAMPPDSDLLDQMEASFEHRETDDQLQAIGEIKADLEREQPMDRLLCGDVGFGKTEVAMRAAFKVVEGGYQVAVLAPTTILADQHLETFRSRFEGLPVKVEMISRRRSATEVREIKERLKAGQVDVLIGTHRLLSRDVEIPRLGLLIVDEEQRFGVAQKERLREFKQSVHVLAMSATPVPRTLQLSLAGVRDLSQIETPPRDRMAVETAIVPFTPELLREAIAFELERQGQVYYVYNRVETIERVAAYLKKLLPDLRLVIGHGQLEENELARRMHAFKAGEYDVLLATTIIENGIDIPNVNTMIVHRADRFGLAQLYQLRGRVGRSHQLGYCYLLVPSDRALPADARKRLAAIREFTELGAGFRVAARDLEIRGAGNILGAEQSGHIAAVGIETYLKMLRDAVRELKGEAVEDAPSVALDLPVPLAIPEDYLSDANLRMEVYRKIASAEVPVSEILEELADRFGPPPPAVHSLLEVAALKRRAEALRVQSVSLAGSRLQIRLRQDARVDLDRLVRLVSARDDVAFSPNGVLELGGVPRGEVVGTARGLLEELAE